MSYASQVIHLHDDFDHRDFPERFSNQVYYSTLTNFKPYSYQSTFSIKFTLEGMEGYALNGRRIYLHPRQVLIVNDGSWVDGFGSNELNRGLSIFIEPRLLSELNANRRLLSMNEIPDTFVGSPSLEFDEHAVYDEKLSMYLSHFAETRLHSSLETYDYVEMGEALLDFRERFEGSLLRTRKVRRSTQLEVARRVNQAVTYLNDTVHITFDLEKVARVSCMSKFLLIRMFKNLVGVTPQRYHQQRRIEMAKQLLRRGCSVTDTSHVLGFSTIHYFSRCFKIIAGCSPVQWRRRGPIL